MIKLRLASPSDGEALARIYAYYVEETGVSFEYDAPSGEEFSRRIAHKMKKYPYIVAERDGRPIGYAYASEFRERAAYGWDAELSVYLDRCERRNGVGRMLYTALTELLKRQNFVNLYAIITLPHDESEAFHSKMGFEKLCEVDRVGYKKGKWYGLTWYRLVLCEGEPKPIIPFPALDAKVIGEILTAN